MLYPWSLYLVSLLMPLSVCLLFVLESGEFMSLDGSRTIDSSLLPKSVLTIFGKIYFLFIFFAVRDPEGALERLLAILVGLLFDETILIIPDFLLIFLFKTPLRFS